MRRISILFLIISLVLISAAWAQSPPSADTFANSSAPKTNYGASPILVVQPGVTTFIRFELSTLPANVSVNKIQFVNLVIDYLT